MSQPLYIFAGGGSGGHLYPGISIAQQIAGRQPQAEIVFLCTSREIDKKILDGFAWRQMPQPITPVPKNPLLIAQFLRNWKASCQMTADLCLANKGRVVVCGLGGFASGAALKTAHKLGVPTAMLNPDALPGKANKFCQKYADRIFVQWRETLGAFGKYESKCVVTGSPVRAGYIRPESELSSDKLYTRELLIFGGSLGGHNVNSAVLSALGQLQSSEPDLLASWKIVHITGGSDYDFVKNKYAQLKYPVEILSYCHEMDKQLKKAALVICRAGASTLAELSAIGLGSILLPYPYHKDQHQFKNAEIFRSRGAAVIVEDTTRDADTAAGLIAALKRCLNKEACHSMAMAAKGIGNSKAAELIAADLMSEE